MVTYIFVYVWNILTIVEWKKRSFYINLCVCVCVCVCVCGHVYVVYEDTNLYNDMGMT